MLNIKTSPTNGAAQMNQSISPKKFDQRFIRIQQIEHELSENEFLKYGLYIALILVIIRLITDFVTFMSRDFVEVGIRAIQVLGYGYGLQAFYSKDRYLAQVLLFFCLISYVLLGYFLYFSVQEEIWAGFGFNIFILVINSFLVLLSKKFSANLEERYMLMKQLGKL